MLAITCSLQGLKPVMIIISVKATFWCLVHFLFLNANYSYPWYSWKEVWNCVKMQKWDVSWLLKCKQFCFSMSSESRIYTMECKVKNSREILLRPIFYDFAKGERKSTNPTKVWMWYLFVSNITGKTCSFFTKFICS